jgi:DNA-binding MarR family transcriptional regulator
MKRDVPRLARSIARDCLGMRARLLGRVLSALYDEALRPVGLNCAQLNLLVALGARGPMPATELGRALRIEKSTLSRNLRRLADLGWIAPGRGLSLTPRGADMLRRAVPAWRGAQRRARALLGHAGAAALAGAAEPARRGATARAREGR